MKKQQSGFTLIELVVVIVILGILAAVATPRFANLSTQAEQSVADGIFGALSSTAVVLLAENDGTPDTGANIISNTTITGGWSAASADDGGGNCDFTLTAPDGTTTYTQDANGTAYQLPSTICTP